MKKKFHCTREDCYYKPRETRADMKFNYGCNYFFLTGKSRIAQLPPDLRSPAQCPLYIKRIDVEKAKAAKQSVKAVPENRRPGSPIWEPLALQLYKDGKNDSQIAEACGVPRHNIANWRYRRNLPGQPDANKTRQRTYLPKRTFDEKKALALYKAGKFDREIAEAVTVSPQTIQRWRKACGLQSHAPSQNYGKAPDYDWIEGLALYEKGFSDRAIAKELGCAPQTVNSWRRREKLPSKYKLKLEGRNG